MVERLRDEHQLKALTGLIKDKFEILATVFSKGLRAGSSAQDMLPALGSRNSV